MAEDWDAVAEDFVQALEEVGFNATLHRSTAGSVPWDGPNSPNEQQVRILNRGLISTKISGSTELRQAHTVAMSHLVEPKLNDQLEMLGRKRKILAVKQVAPGGVVLLYRVEIEQ